MRIVFIGAGRLATNLAPALSAASHQIVQVFSRSMQSAVALAGIVGAEAVDSLAAVTDEADVFIFSVTDTALPQLAAQLCRGREKCIFLHTAGSVPLSVFAQGVNSYGVLYPMQTFSKERRVDFKRLTFFIEGNDERALAVARTLAASVSNSVVELSSEDRRHLHLAAVFACNFANHCYELSAEILERHGLTFDVMLPLIEETAAKVHGLSPREAQTGPAVRFDESVMQAQLQLLCDQPRLAEVYEVMSKSIHQSHIQKAL